MTLPMMLRRFPATPWEGLDVPSALLLGIQRNPGPPVHVGPHRFERLRIVIIDRDDPSALDEDDNDDGGEIDEPEILPRLSLVRGRPVPPSRPVQGEILRGENGALYERFGQRIRPLRGLATGPRGEVLEIAAVPAGQQPETGDRRQGTPTDRGQETEDRRPGAGDRGQNGDRQPDGSPPPVSGRLSPEIRALFSAPGHWRVVRFGEFRPCLAPQLEEPARLRDAHWLPCHAQVFELAPTQSREALAALVLGSAARAGEFLPVTPPLIHALQLATVLPQPVRGALYFAHLSPAHDPTQRVEPPAQETADGRPGTVDRKPQSPPPPAASRPAPEPTAPVRKTEIPAAHLQNAPFVLSREAAYQDLLDDDQAAASRVRRWFASPRIDEHALREWQLQLSGRSADEQLWAVPPPAGWRRDTGIRTWAAHALERAGYDSALLSEWRLYWRRRGC